MNVWVCVGVHGYNKLCVTEWVLTCMCSGVPCAQQLNTCI